MNRLARKLRLIPVDENWKAEYAALFRFEVKQRRKAATQLRIRNNATTRK